MYTDKFQYPEYEAISLDDMRFYIIDEQTMYPSITTMLGKTASRDKVESLMRWQRGIGIEAAAAHTQEACRHGTCLHLLAERFLKGEELVQDAVNDEIVEKDIGAFNTLRPMLKHINEIWCQEKTLCSHTLQLAGRTDLIGVYDGVESIIDFKTSGRLKDHDDIDDYRLQLCAYAIMHNEMFGTNISQGVVLMISAAGFPQKFIVDLMPEIPILCARIDDFFNQF